MIAFPIRWKVRAVSIVLVCLPNALSNCSAIAQHAALAQEPTVKTGAVTARTPEFEVVSIRPSKPGSLTAMAGIQGNEYRSINLPLSAAIMRAYFPLVLALNSDRLVGAPNWVNSERYDIVAKVAADDLAEWQGQHEKWSSGAGNEMLTAMLRKMLAERCNLTVHQVPFSVQGYALQAGKNGPDPKKLRSSTPDEAVPSSAMKIPDGGFEVAPMADQPPIAKFFKTSMASFATVLTFLNARPVEDRTGISGKYDFDVMRWRNDDGSYSWDVEALGLKLQSVQIPSEKLVIDHIDRPSAN